MIDPATTLVVTCGPGGVGKTTTSAALGVAAARQGRKVVVVTVDPARRLADALGLGDDAHADEPHRVTGVPGLDDGAGGELWALMLDAATTFDRLVHEQSAQPAQAQAILANPVYKAISGSLSGAQEYMAIERLHQLHSGGEWDLVIVDTPPSRHAIDLLEAPDRLVGFLSHPVYRTLTAGQRAFAKITDAAASMFLWVVRRLAGPQIVEDTVAFFRSLAHIEGGLRRRASDVSTLLRSETTAFVVVTSPRAESIAEAEHLVTAIRAGGFPLGEIVVNLIHPLPDELPDSLAVSQAVPRVDGPAGPLADHLAWHGDLRSLALAERDEMAGLIELAGDVEVIELPLLDEDVHDLGGLAVLATQLTP
jgi:anion-transporting  ArsA/GET3 family ATPase